MTRTTKVWNYTSWSDRDSAQAMVGGASRTMEITAVGRTRHGPKNVYYFSLSFSLDFDFSSTRRQRRLKRIFKVHHRERTSLTCISIVGVYCSCRYTILLFLKLLKLLSKTRATNILRLYGYITYCRAQVTSILQVGK